MKVEFTPEEKKKPFMKFRDAELGRICKASMLRLCPSDQNIMQGAMAAVALLTIVAEASENKELVTEFKDYKISVTLKED